MHICMQKAAIYLDINVHVKCGKLRGGVAYQIFIIFFLRHKIASFIIWVIAHACVCVRVGNIRCDLRYEIKRLAMFKC